MPPRSKGTEDEVDLHFDFLSEQQESSDLQHSLHTLVQLGVGQQGALVGQHSLHFFWHGSAWTRDREGRSRRMARIRCWINFIPKEYRSEGRGQRPAVDASRDCSWAAAALASAGRSSSRYRAARRFHAARFLGSSCVARSAWGRAWEYISNPA